MSTKMTPEEARKILAKADAHTTYDEEGEIIITGDGPSLEEIVEATEILESEEKSKASKKEMTPEEARKIMKAAATGMKIDPSDGLLISTGKGPAMDKIFEAVEVLAREKRTKGAKKSAQQGMSVEEALKVLAAADAHTTRDEDGAIVFTGDGPSLEQIVQATEVLEQKKQKKEAHSGEEKPKKMSLFEAQRVLDKVNPAEKMVDDDGKMQEAWQVVKRAMETEERKLKSGEIWPTQVEAMSPTEAFETLRQHAREAREKGGKSFLGRLFSKKEQPYQWENSLRWEDVKFESPRGQVLFSHRIDLEYLTPDQERQVREGLKKHGIKFTERQATSTVGAIQQGDRTLRISDRESVEKLRYMVFHWAQGRFSKPVSMPVEEYNAMQERIAQKKPSVPIQKPRVPEPEPERPFDWKDPMCWQSVKFKEGDEILFSHRLRLEGLTSEQEKEAKEGLTKYHINFEERAASSDDGKIKKGDRTLRISDKESIKQLRAMVFNWVQGTCAKPVSKPFSEYVADEAKRAVAERAADSK